MNQTDYYDWAEKFCHSARMLSMAKNNDYADPDAKGDDPFAVWANFTACEKLGICSTEQGMLVRMLDKLVRVSNLTRPSHQQQVKDEAIEDTLLDLHNYSQLMAGYLKAKKEQG